MQIDDFRDTSPRFLPEEYFRGTTRAWGFFQDRFGRIRREFTVDIEGTFDGRTLILDERFVYADGERQRRVWTIRKTGADTYEGTADDIVGVAHGRVAGRAMNWRYDFELPVGSGRLRTHFDDWMMLQDAEVLLNRTSIRKLGVGLGEVVIFFRKIEPARSAWSGEMVAQNLQHAAE